MKPSPESNPEDTSNPWIPDSVEAEKLRIEIAAAIEEDFVAWLERYH